MASEFPRGFEHAIDAGATHGNYISVEHHVRQPPMSFQRVEILEGDDRGLFPIFQPKITRDGGVVLVGSSQPLAPAIEFAPGDSQPSNQDHQHKGQCDWPSAG